MKDSELEDVPEEDHEASRLIDQYYEGLTKDSQNRPPGLWALPPRHSFAHSYCFLLHDALGRMVVNATKEMFWETLELSVLPEDARKEFTESKMVGARLIDWLEENGQRDFVERLYEKRVIHALVIDACSFIYEALRCSEKGKLAITFALLRKPLRENLLVLELLLGDRARFFELFSKDIGKLGIYALPKSETALPIITKALSRIRLSETFNAEFLFDLRYAKHKHFSLEGLWNKAAHLVTTARHFPTEPENFNFVFSDLEAHDTQWDALYSRLPYLLLYFVEVVESLMQHAVSDWTPDDRDHSQRDLGLSIAGYLTGSKPFDKSPLAGFAFDCPLCGHPTLNTLTRLERYYWTRVVRCQSCGVQVTPVKDHYSVVELKYRLLRTRFKRSISGVRSGLTGQ